MTNTRKIKVLVLCHGNINRSPLCAAILNQYPQLEVRQAGLKPNLKPGRASKKMRDAALELGLNLEEHRSQPLTVELYGWADYIVIMDGGNYERLCQFYSDHTKDLERIHGAPTYLRLGYYEDGVPRARIPDPAFIKRGIQEFDDVVRLINRCSRNLAKKLIAGSTR